MDDRLKVLLIEDNPGDADLLREALEEPGIAPVEFELEHVDRLSQAVQCLERQTFDAILLDLSLPDSQGSETYARLRARNPDIPIVVVSGLSDQTAALQAVQGGVQDFLSKDRIQADSLVPTIRYAIERHRLQTAAEQRLRQAQESEARLHHLIEHNADGILIVNRSGIVRFVNPAAEALLGRKAEELLGEVFGFPVVTGETTELDILQPGGKTAVAEVRVVETEWEAEVAYLASLRDTTERKRQEARNLAGQQVREAVWKMRSADDVDQLLATVRVGLETLAVPFHWCGINTVDASTDPPEVRIHNMTTEEEWSSDTIVEPNYVVTQFWREGVPVYRKDLDTEDLYQERTGIAKEVRAVLDMPFSHGTLAVNSTEPDAFSDQDITSLQALGEVLSEGFRRMDDLRALEEKEAQLRQSQKMESIGQLAGGVAHDFNNLITVITGYCQFLLKGLSPHDPRRPQVEQIKKAGNKAASLIRQLLAFSRRQILQPEVLDLNKIVLEVEKMLGRLIGEHFDLALELDPDLGTVRADPGQVEQAIVNLVVNARDAMPQGGQLTIETTNSELDVGYAHQRVAVQPGPYVMLAVSDTGVGMDEETRARIFEPFFTTKDVDKGTGLGLSTVYGIVKQSEGYIWVYSEPGLGTTIKIYLPRIQAVVEAGKKEEEPADSLHGSETILLVEDEQMVMDMVCQALVGHGYMVLPAPSGEQALQVCAQHEGPIHLLVTDVVMPGMSGPELAQRLVPLYPEMTAVYMSGYADHTIVRHGLLEPGTVFLQKPFNPDDLALKVREVLDAPLSGA